MTNLGFLGSELLNNIYFVKGFLQVTTGTLEPL